MKKTKNQDFIHLIDIGNTSATYGAYKSGGKLHYYASDMNNIPNLIHKNQKSGINSSNIVVICSVVPKNTELMTSAIYSKVRNVTVYEIGKDIPLKIRHNYKNIGKLGNDRKINAYGAVLSNKLPCLVFDFGTALTCDLIDEKGVFLGGLIIPGPATSLKSLLNQTALLPKVFQLKKESGLPFGRNTHECIQHGVIQAYAAMADGLITKLSGQFKKKPHIIITGGFSLFIGKIIRSKAQINPAHTLESMLKLYTAWKK